MEEACQENDARAADRGWRTSLLGALKRAANCVGQFFGRERLVQETAAAFEDPTLSQGSVALTRNEKIGRAHV